MKVSVEVKMREIKFRVWLNEDEFYLYDGFILSNNGKEIELYDEHGDEIINFVIEQYTGLKDKNGKEIYEGDIVKLSESNWWQSHKIIKEKYNAIVSFNERTREIQFKEIGGRYKIDYHYFLQNTETKLYFEVIGNIHENAELLKGK